MRFGLEALIVRAPIALGARIRVLRDTTPIRDFGASNGHRAGNQCGHQSDLIDVGCFSAVDHCCVHSQGNLAADRLERFEAESFVEAPGSLTSITLSGAAPTMIDSTGRMLSVVGTALLRTAARIPVSESPEVRMSPCGR
jgi:hypothetical protein